MLKRYALCVGINDYPGSGSDLAGCVNDAHDWHVTLLSRGYDVRMLLDGEANKKSIVEVIRERLSRLKAGDRFVFTFSGHGTWIPDRDGDEIDGRDEALCCYDYASGGLLVDDEMFEMFKNRAFGSRVTLLSDSCHSGTVTRLAMDPAVHKTVRFLPPTLFTDLTEKEAARAELDISGGKPRSDAVLISGCADHEFSYDAHFGNRPNGAFTYFARQALDQSPSPRVKDVYDTLKALLPSQEYPQSPQLTAGIFQRGSSLL